MTLVHYSPFLAYKKMLGCDAQNNRVIGIDWKEFVLDAMATTVCYPHQMHLGEKKVTSIPYSGSRHGLRTPNESFFFKYPKYIGRLLIIIWRSILWLHIK